MKTEKTIGSLFIMGAIGVLVPYILLTIIFDYPNILRQEPGVILSKFKDGGTPLICAWWAFALLGLPLLKANILLGQKLEHISNFARWATILGTIGLLTQMIGLLRWTFVVPVLAHNFTTGDQMTQVACKLAFQVVHQYGGVILGEHIGQLFTIAWTLIMTRTFAQIKLFPKWVTCLGYGSSIIYLFAQTELFATVIPTFPVVSFAGFIGSTLWIAWLITIGITIRNRTLDTTHL